MRVWWEPVAVALVQRTGQEADVVVEEEEEGDRQLKQAEGGEEGGIRQLEILADCCWCRMRKGCEEGAGMLGLVCRSGSR